MLTDLVHILLYTQNYWVKDKCILGRVFIYLFSFSFLFLFFSVNAFAMFGICCHITFCRGCANVHLHQGHSWSHLWPEAQDDCLLSQQAENRLYEKPGARPQPPKNKRLLVLPFEQRRDGPIR